MADNQPIIASSEESSSLVDKLYSPSNVYDLEDPTIKINIRKSNDDKVPLRTKLVVLCILLTEFSDSIAISSVTANIILFANTHLGFTNPQAVTLNFIFTGIRCAFPLLGGCVADAFLGQYNMMYAGSLAYILGVMAIFSVTIPFSDPFSNGAKIAFYLLGLFLVAAGSGGVKSIISPFGARQLENCNPIYIQRFFAWYYFFTNVGALISFTVVAYVQQNVSFFYGYMIPAIALVMGTTIFALPRNYYRNSYPKGSLLGDIIGITYQSFKSKFGCKTVLVDTNNIKSFFDYAKKENGGKFDASIVEKIKPLGRVVPIFLLIVLFRMIYFQMITTWFLQGESMNLYLGKLKLPAAALTTFDIIAVLIFIPVVNYGVYPLYQRIFGAAITPLQRIGTGMVFASLAMVVAGIVERYRLIDVHENPLPQIISGKVFNASANISILAQIPQFALIGLGETFTSVTGFEFAYSEAPEELKGIMTGLYLLAIGLGGFIGPLVITIINAITYDPKVVNSKWIPKNINNGHLDYYFYFLAVFMLVNFLVYVIMTKFWYKNESFPENCDPRTSGRPPEANLHSLDKESDFNVDI
ncbi:Protein NRT1/ PTR FAMILY 8.2 [Trichoplax sp. H2]|nr:Protein NRT1/ PTR FAMILY 8.2 [Trichoplax sp. H2]|eukprot:RDD40601.1 Protein NRT1/ PTR FAMILY 8.2 [Trichoplax sp. H2]